MKKIITAFIALLLAVTLSGCIPDSLGEYKKAVEKTKQLQKGRTSGEYTIAMDFNTEGMTDEQLKELNYIKNINGSFDVMYDDEAGKKIIRNYMSLGGLGFDFDLFVNGEEMFIKLPITGKYLRLNKQQAPKHNGQNYKDMELLSKESINEISSSWLGMLKEEDIFKGRNIILTTPDGEVKTTEYAIKLNDSQLKSLAADVIDILQKDEKLKAFFNKYAEKEGTPLEGKDLEKLLKGFREDIRNYKVENFSHTSHVDIDGYIVNEMIEISAKVENAEIGAYNKKPGDVTGFSYRLNMKNWDINKEQEIEIPVLTEENTLEMDQIDGNMPFMFEDLMNIKD